MALPAKAATIGQTWPLLTVQDIEHSVAFYRDHLGFAVCGRAADADGRLFWCRLERGGSSLMLQQADKEDGPTEDRGRGVALYFICDDVDAVHAELAAFGLRVEAPRVTTYGMKQLFVPEPDGYEICFESPTEDWAG